MLSIIPSDCRCLNSPNPRTSSGKEPLLSSPFYSQDLYGEAEFKGRTLAVLFPFKSDTEVSAFEFSWLRGSLSCWLCLPIRFPLSGKHMSGSRFCPLSALSALYSWPTNQPCLTSTQWALDTPNWGQMGGATGCLGLGEGNTIVWEHQVLLQKRVLSPRRVSICRHGEHVYAPSCQRGRSPFPEPLESKIKFLDSRVTSLKTHVQWLSNASLRSQLL